MKNILKPTKLNVVLFVILLVVTIFIPKYDLSCPRGLECTSVTTTGMGYPLFYGERWHGDYVEFGFYPEMLVINLVIYYVLSCLVVFIIKR